SSHTSDGLRSRKYKRKKRWSSLALAGTSDGIPGGIGYGTKNKHVCADDGNGAFLYFASAASRSAASLHTATSPTKRWACTSSSGTPRVTSNSYRYICV